MQQSFEWQRKGGTEGTAKFREETSKKADSAVSDRIAAMHNLAMPSLESRSFCTAAQNDLDNRATDE